MYKTKVVVDEEMPVWTEKSLDDKFKPEAVWTTSFLKDEKKTKVLGNDGRELKEGFLKIKTKRESEEYHIDIPFLIYIKADALKSVLNYMKSDGLDVKSNLIAIDKLVRWAPEAVFNKFYECGECKGYIEGDLAQENYNDIGHLSGSKGIKFKCERCGTTLDAQVFVRS